MTNQEANMIIRAFCAKPTATEEEFYLFTEAAEYHISTNHDPEVMMLLGGAYYERKDFDLALKYYEMAMAHGHQKACECLGYIWYYGRTGITDYPKALECFTKGMELGNLVCAYKVADMYKNGYGVEKDYDIYVRMITDLCKKIDGDRKFDVINGPGPEIYSRMGGIDKKRGDYESALNWYWPAKAFLQERMMNSSFFGNFSIMRYLVKDIFSLCEFDPHEEYFDMYDLYYLEDRPFIARFDYVADTYEIRAEQEEDGSVAFEFDGHWYHTYTDFLQKAVIKGKHLYEFWYYDFRNWEVAY